MPPAPSRPAPANHPPLVAGHALACNPASSPVTGLHRRRVSLPRAPRTPPPLQWDGPQPKTLLPRILFQIQPASSTNVSRYIISVATRCAHTVGSVPGYGSPARVGCAQRCARIWCRPCRPAWPAVPHIMLAVQTVRRVGSQQTPRVGLQPTWQRHVAHQRRQRALRPRQGAAAQLVRRAGASTAQGSGGIKVHHHAGGVHFRRSAPTMAHSSSPPSWAGLFMRMRTSAFQPGPTFRDLVLAHLAQGLAQPRAPALAPALKKTSP